MGDTAGPSNSNPGATEEDEESTKGVWEQIREQRAKSGGIFEFMMQTFAILSVTAGCTVLLVLLLLLPIAIFIVGIINLNDCPVNKWIPIYLVVLGAVGIFQNLTVLTRKCCSDGVVKCIAICQLPVNIFLIGWFIAGNIWVYGTFSEVQHKNETMSSTYCDHTTYWFAFWLITLVYILIGLCLILGCCAMCVITKMAKDNADKEANEETPIVPEQEK